MDYLQIVVEGYFIESNKILLENYFYKKYKKAEKDYYEEHVFFSCCHAILDCWETDLFNSMYKNQNEWYMKIDRLNSSKRKNINVLSLFEKELEYSKNINNYSLQLSLQTNNIILYNIKLIEIVFIKNAIYEAMIKAKK